jgi:hypothetical protein
LVADPAQGNQNSYPMPGLPPPLTVVDVRPLPATATALPAIPDLQDGAGFAWYL